MKVIGAGLPRTGTSSLKAALDRLGLGPTYHMFELMQHPEHVERWLPVMKGEQASWGDVFDGYRSAVDFPASVYWRELAEAYPDAKIILTVRDPHRWYESIRTMLPPAATEQNDGMPPTPDQMPGRMQAYAELLPLMLEAAKERLGGQEYLFGGRMGEQEAIELFDRHVATVRAALPSERLLVFRASDGWGPLCEFLGVEEPVDEPYPHLNDARTIQKMFTTMMETDELVVPFERQH